MVDRGLGDLMEHHALHRDLRLEVLEKMPADGLALAVFVGGEVQLAGIFHQHPQVPHHLCAANCQLICRLETVVDVDRQTLAGQVGDVPNRGAHIERVAQELGDGLGLCGGFDDDKWFGHVLVSLRDGGGPCQGAADLVAEFATAKRRVQTSTDSGSASGSCSVMW